ncbi:hypothetical protein [Croceicoccus marinus]|jgi:hypothetical protein|uniref:Uncharacterized protein n=1 Tax=Croceicoccus marinus TaxID=450378 RepID=A0A1Z1FBP3_9SPHN|nr:hypothetical protein [Croceicoccus marinus]ARU16229.1 hypothetical protein A9D14_08485 [Croceicoccus marinus]QNE06376.1 hypothetical protein H4O24_07230 [Croceicoccus marinus]
MSFWTAIILIVLIISVTQMIKGRRDARDGLYTDRSGTLRPRPDGLSPEDEEQLRAEIAELKERVHVLERIATDERQKLGLAEEIELLRDR